MTKYVRINNTSNGTTVLDNGKWCDSSWCHFKGLMFRQNLPHDDGLVFVRRGMSVMNTTIHMFFCFFPIGVIWLDDELKVVDAKLAKPWRPSYAPKGPAQYFIEANPHVLENVSEGDQLAFKVKA